MFEKVVHKMTHEDFFEMTTFWCMLERICYLFLCLTFFELTGTQAQDGQEISLQAVIYKSEEDEPMIQSVYSSDLFRSPLISILWLNHTAVQTDRQLTSMLTQA